MMKTSIAFFIILLVFAINQPVLAQSDSSWIQGITLRYGGSINGSFPRMEETDTVFVGGWQDLYTTHRIFPLALSYRRTMIGDQFYRGLVADIGQRAQYFQSDGDEFVTA